MHRTEFEKHARKFWTETYGENAKGSALVNIEKLVQVTVGLAYAEKLLEQGRKP